MPWSARLDIDKVIKPVKDALSSVKNAISVRIYAQNVHQVYIFSEGIVLLSAQIPRIAIPTASACNAMRLAIPVEEPQLIAHHVSLSLYILGNSARRKMTLLYVQRSNGLFVLEMNV